jgi:hypothetical protein
MNSPRTFRQDYETSDPTLTGCPSGRDFHTEDIER